MAAKVEEKLKFRVRQSSELIVIQNQRAYKISTWLAFILQYEQILIIN